MKLVKAVAAARRAAPLLLALLAPAALAPALARDGVDVGENSAFTKLVSAEQIEQSASLQYRQTLQQAGQQRALAPENNPQLQRLRAIAKRIIPHAVAWNPRARDWKWAVKLIDR